LTGKERQVAWPRLKVGVTREEAYGLLTMKRGICSEDLNSLLQPGKHYSATTASGERFTGTVEFVCAGRGFCLTVREMMDALLWLTIEGVPGNIEVQAWLSAFGLPGTSVDTFHKTWESRLKQLFV